MALLLHKVIKCCKYSVIAAGGIIADGRGGVAATCCLGAKWSSNGNSNS